MLRKLISMAIASLMMAGGLTLVSAPVASATDDATLASVTIKGVAATSLGTPTNSLDFQRLTDQRSNNGTISLTTPQAALTSGTVVTANDPNARITLGLFNENSGSCFMEIEDFPGGSASSCVFNDSSSVGDIDGLAIQVISGAITKYYLIYITVAESNDATLSSVTIKGVTATLGTPGAAEYLIANEGSVTLTAAEASSNASTTFVKNNSLARSLKAVVYDNSTNMYNPNTFDTVPAYNNESLTDGKYFLIKIEAEDRTTTKFYKILVTVSSAPQSSDATLNRTSSFIKGINPSTLNAQTQLDGGISNNANLVTVNLTSAEASGNAATNFTATDSGAAITFKKFSPLPMPFNTNSFNQAPNMSLGSTASLANGDVIVVRVIAEDGSVKYYGFSISVSSSGSNNNQISATTVISNITETSADVNFSTLAAAQSGVSTWNARLFVVVGSTSTFLNSRVALSSSPSVSLTGLTPGTTYSIFFGNPNHPNGVNYGYEPGQRFTTLSVGGGSSSPSVDLAALQAAAAAEAAAAIAAAKTKLVDTLKAGKPLTASDLSAADIPVVSAKAADRVNAKILALPVDKRADLSTVAALVRTENFVDRVSNESTKVLVTARDLVAEKLVTSDNKNKVTILREILKQDAASLDSIEKVAAAVKAAAAKIQARKDRTFAIIAKIKG